MNDGKSTTQNAIGTSELFPEDYNVFRNDRNELGGGVFIMTHKSLTAEEQSDLVTDGEMNWVKIKLQNMKKISMQESKQERHTRTKKTNKQTNKQTKPSIN